jgi:hypothetical protein
VVSNSREAEARETYIDQEKRHGVVGFVQALSDLEFEEFLISLIRGGVHVSVRRASVKCLVKEQTGQASANTGKKRERSGKESSVLACVTLPQPRALHVCI